MNRWRQLREKLVSNVYNPDEDPLIQERNELQRRTDEVVQVLATYRHPATGMTLADMAANRYRDIEAWTSSLNSAKSSRPSPSR